MLSATRFVYLTIGLTTAAIVMVWARAAAAGPLDDLAGAWRGERAEGASIAVSDLNMQIRLRGNGFELTWSEPGIPGSGLTTIRFVETDRSGVYAEGRGGGWLFSMFGDDKPTNPLQGDTLRWARTEGDALIVYRLDVAKDGGYRLDRYAWEATGGEATFAYEERTHDDVSIRASGRMSRSEGRR